MMLRQLGAKAQGTDFAEFLLPDKGFGPLQSDVEAVVIEGLEQIVERVHLERAHGVSVERRHENRMKRAGVAPSDIDRVCLTGGTAKVPAVVAALQSRFGEERISSHRAFHSVVYGLALHARSLIT